MTIQHAPGNDDNPPLGCNNKGPYTKTRPPHPPTPPLKKGYPGAGGYGGQNAKNHWGIIFGPKMMILQGVRR